MNNLLNVRSVDPFKEAGEENLDAQGELIHIRVQQRNNRKRLTTVQGIPRDTVDIKLLLKRLRKVLNCNGCIVNHAEYGAVIQLQGDKRKGVAQFLKTKKLVDANTIHIHGV